MPEQNLATNNVFDIESQETVFNNKNAVNPRHDPDREEIVCRADEITDLQKKLRPIVMGHTADPFYVNGGTGTGKTLCSRLVVDDLKEKMEDQTTFTSVYITNVQNERDPLLQIAQQLDLDHKGYELSKYYDQIKEQIIQEDITLLIVLDEIDKIFQNDKSKGNSLLKKLLDTQKEIMNADTGSLNFFGITNDTKLMQYFDGDVDSRFSGESVHFPSYDAMQLREILDVRADRAFKDGVLKEGVISKCAALVGGEDGDAREAIRLLRKTGEIAEEKRTDVENEYVNQAKERVERNRVIESVQTLTKHKQYLLYGIIDNYNLHGDPMKTGEAYDHYVDVCTKESRDPLTQRRITDLLNDLDTEGIINAQVISQGRKGRTRLIKVGLSPKIVDEMQSIIESNFKSNEW